MSARIFDPRPCELGEGPLWHPARGQLFWFDILGKRLLSEGQEWVFNRHVSAAGWVGRDGLLVATETDLMLLDIETGTQDHVAPLEADNPATRSNDGRADPWGGFWIGTMGKRAEPGAGAIYRYYRGEVRQLHAPITIPNAICFSPDGGHAHFADTARGIVWRQRLSDTDGWPLGEPQVYLDHGADGPNPDGAVVDAAGRFWCAEWGSSRVRCYGPDGAVLQEVALPVSQPSCPAFGGPDLRDLYITTAREHMTAAALAAEPLAGQLFIAPDMGQGQTEHEVIL
ncbi:SMP-30/gluconolactonase/LRE family protein [Rhodobacteraceae bacterium W635]|uniref:SMP-30/gluconolactonase/LRE family protein n=1 Tax=Nioella halotolerans TaxID=2303578 RepID=UPI000E3D9DEB|nr:SMP-30/gluconolactonase/LRE family protein [Rhodobacteraceae bacterium W635]